MRYSWKRGVQSYTKEKVLVDQLQGNRISVFNSDNTHNVKGETVQT